MLQSISEVLLERLDQRGILGRWTWDWHDQSFQWSRGVYRIVGRDPETTRPDLELYRRIVHPDDQLRLDRPNQVLKAGKLFQRRYRVIRPDATVRSVVSVSAIVRSPELDRQFLAGLLVDTTELDADRAASQFGATLAPALARLTGANFAVALADPAAERPTCPPIADLRGEDFARWERFWQETVRSGHKGEAVMRRPGIGRGDLKLRAEPAGDVPADHAATSAPGLWIGMVRPTEAEPTDAPARDPIVGVQLRAARAMLGLAIDDLADLSGVSASTIRRIEAEDGRSQVRAANLERLRSELEARGIRFTGSADEAPGVAFAVRRQATT